MVTGLELSPGRAGLDLADCRLLADRAFVANFRNPHSLEDIIGPAGHSQLERDESIIDRHVANNGDGEVGESDDVTCLQVGGSGWAGWVSRGVAHLGLPPGKQQSPATRIGEFSGERTVPAHGWVATTSLPCPLAVRSPAGFRSFQPVTASGFQHAVLSLAPFSSRGYPPVPV